MQYLSLFFFFFEQVLFFVFVFVLIFLRGGGKCMVQGDACLIHLAFDLTLGSFDLITICTYVNILYIIFIFYFFVQPIHRSFPSSRDGGPSLSCPLEI